MTGGDDIHTAISGQIGDGDITDFMFKHIPVTAQHDLLRQGVRKRTIAVKYDDAVVRMGVTRYNVK